LFQEISLGSHDLHVFELLDVEVSERIVLAVRRTLFLGLAVFLVVLDDDLFAALVLLAR
jgi:hypothetical protein